MHALLRRLGDFYRRAYDGICGKHPHLRPWHFQWLAVKDIYWDLRRVLPSLRGKVLDVGCGEKPYAVWMTGVEQHVGVDVFPGPRVDTVITPEQRWPFDDTSFDAVLCTQVLEHVSDLDHVLAEIHRLLKPGGRLVVTVPFLYNQHGAPNDYRRFSLYGVRQLFAPHYEIEELRSQGRAGGTITVLWLNWLDLLGAYRPAAAILRGILFPIWVVGCGVLNGSALVVDWLDCTDCFYANVLLVARKPAS